MIRSMRVALVSEHASPLATLGSAETGGQNVYVDALARHLAADGCQVDVYTRRSDPGEAPSVELAEGVVVHHVTAGPAAPVPRDDLLPLMPAFADGLRTALRRRRPSLVHAHFWMSGWAAMAAHPGVPVVQTFHALGAVKRRHQGAADTSPPERVEVERDLATRADLVIATCQDEVDELRRLGAPDDRIAVVPCGVGDEFSPFGAVDRRTDRPRLVCVSRLVPRKGIADVVRALGLVGSPDVELVVVGGPDPADVEADGEVGALRRLAADAGVDDRVRFTGRLPSSAVAAVMRSADAVVCAPWYEPFGIVPVEAMACGAPVIGTAVGGLLDTVRHGSTGLLVPARRPDQLARAIDSMLADPARRRRMGAAAAQRANAYRWPRVTRSVLESYESAIERRSATREVALA